MSRLKKTEIYFQPTLVNTLKVLGEHISLARRKRRISIRDMSTRMMVTPTTLIKIEKGDPGVAIGSVVKALWILGLQKRLEQLISPETDQIGLSMEAKSLPQRVRKKNKNSEKVKSSVLAKIVNFL